MPRDESQLLVLLMGEQEQQQQYQQQQQQQFLSKPVAQHRHHTPESSLFSDSEHSGFYALPYNVQQQQQQQQQQQPALNHNHTTEQTSASALPKVQTENSQAAQHPRGNNVWSSPWESLDGQSYAAKPHNYATQNRYAEAQMNFGSTFDHFSMHSDDAQSRQHWQSLYGYTWNPLLAKMARDRKKVTSHVQSQQYSSGLQTNPYLNQRTVFEQQSIPNSSSSSSNQPRFRTQQQSSSNNNFHDPSQSHVGAATSVSSSISDSTHGASSSHLIQRPQFPFPSPRSDSNSPDSMPPFSPSSSSSTATAASQYSSSSDYISDTTTSSSSVDESEETRDTASVCSLDSYELMANLFSSQLSIGGASQNTTLIPTSVFSPIDPSSNATSARDNATAHLVHPISQVGMTSYSPTGQQSQPQPQPQSLQQQISARDGFRRVSLRAAPSTNPWLAGPSPISPHQQRFFLPFDQNNSFSQEPSAPTAAIGPNHSQNVDPDQQQHHHRHHNHDLQSQETPQSNTHACVYSIVYEVEFKRNTLRFVGGSGLDDLTVGEFVIVEADRGEHLGQVSQILLVNSPPVIQSIQNNCNCPGGVCTSDCETVRHSLHHPNSVVSGHVLRRATMQDVQKITSKSKEEARATLVANQKVKDFVLDMDIIDSEFQFDRKKLTFFYKAQQRVDFRELVRDLYKLYRARIWMQKVDENFPLI